MLHNDKMRDNKNLNLLNTRSLQNTAAQHHKNNPHVSMEATFAYVMSNSSTFRALPAACIAKARRYLALPNPEDDAKAKFKQASSEKLSDIFAGLNEALQELADSGQPLFLCGLPGSDGVSQVLCEYHVPPIDVVKEALETPTEKIDGHLPLNGQQTVDYLVGLTNDLAGQPVHRGSTLGYIFNCAIGRLGLSKTLHVVDVIEARKRLGLPTVLIESVAQCRDPTHQKEPAKQGTTVVHAERVVVDNRKMIKILKFGNIVYMKTLPKDYLEGLPKFYRCNGWHKELIMLHETIGATNTLAYSVSPGTIMSLKDFGQMIKTMKESGVRLAKISKTAKLEKEHSGKFTVSI